MKIITIHIIAALIALSYSVCGQDQESIGPSFDDLNLRCTYNFATANEFNLGFSLTNKIRASIFEGAGHYGPFIDFGYTNKTNGLFSSKIGYEISGALLIMCGRVSFINYTDFNNSQFYFSPEIGVSALGVLNLTYGYNFNISQLNYYKLNGHHVSLNMKIKLIDLKK